MDDSLIQLLIVVGAAIISAVFSHLKKKGAAHGKAQQADDAEEVEWDDPTAFTGDPLSDQQRELEEMMKAYVDFDADGEEESLAVGSEGVDGVARAGVEPDRLDSPLAGAFTPIDRLPDWVAAPAQPAAAGYSFGAEEEGRAGYAADRPSQADGAPVAAAVGVGAGRRGRRRVNLRDAIVYDAVLRRPWAGRGGVCAR